MCPLEKGVIMEETEDLNLRETAPLVAPRDLKQRGEGIRAIIGMVLESHLVEGNRPFTAD